MSEQGENFDKARETYEAAQKRVLDLTETPNKSLSVSVYRAHLKGALKAQQRAHKAMMEAWA
jgi:hypothetical protein